MSRNLAVGLVVGVSATILLGAVLMLGQDQALFSNRNEYLLMLPGVDGLGVGSPVKLAGVQVGTVTGIRLPLDLEVSNIRVTLGIERSVADRLRADTEAKTRNLSLLSGEKYIELSLGTPGQPVLEPGASIRASASDFDRLASQGTAVADDLAEITSTLRLIFERIEEQEGVLGRLLMEPEFGQDSVEDLRRTLASLRRVSAQLEGTRGLLGAALNDPELRDRVAGGLAQVLDRLDGVLASLANPETPLGSLLSTRGAGSETLADVRDAAAALRELTRRIGEGDGLLPRLLSDGEYADRVLGDLEVTMRNLARITSRIDRGEGTVGALVNDPDLYRGLRDVVTGVQESRLLRWLINRYARRGAEAREEGG